METDSDALPRLLIDAASLFVLSGSMRILRENDPDRSAGPRLFVAGCSTGNLAFVRHDVSDQVALQILHLLTAAPPWLDPGARPVGFPEVLDLLAREMPITSVGASLIYALPRLEFVQGGARLICSDSDEAASLLDTFRRKGLPRHLVEAGFVSVGDLWAPWCAALDGDVIVAIAFAARLGEQGAEVGVYTFPGWRSRGLAAVVTAKWSTLPELVGRELFYSTAVTNVSSRRVAARLGLRQPAVGLRVT
jgi:hypothetical protein